MDTSPQADGSAVHCGAWRRTAERDARPSQEERYVTHAVNGDRSTFGVEGSRGETVGRKQPHTTEENALIYGSGIDRFGRLSGEPRPVVL